MGVPAPTDSLNQFHFEAGRGSSQPYFLQGTNAWEHSPLRKQVNAIQLERSAAVERGGPGGAPAAPRPSP